MHPCLVGLFWPGERFSDVIWTIFSPADECRFMASDCTKSNPDLTMICGAEVVQG